MSVAAVMDVISAFHSSSPDCGLMFVSGIAGGPGSVGLGWDREWEISSGELGCASDGVDSRQAEQQTLLLCRVVSSIPQIYATVCLEAKIWPCPIHGQALHAQQRGFRGGEESFREPP